TITAAPAVSTKRRKGVVIRDPEEELPSEVPVETPKVKDKGKGILIKAAKPIKKKDQIELDAEYARKLQEEINKEHEEVYKNIDWNAALDHSREEMEKEDEEIFKSINETPAQKATKRRKLSEEAQEADDLRKRLKIVQDEDDDVFVEATPLAQKIPVVDYQIVVIDNKPNESKDCQSNIDAARLKLKLFKDAATVAHAKAKPGSDTTCGGPLLNDAAAARMKSVCYKKMDQDSSYMVAASKVPMLKPGEYELWRMRMEQYIQMIDYSLWEVIENGNAPQITKVCKGVETTIAHTTAEEKAQRKLELKERITLLMGIPNEH
nr:ribonuclease H-like domain-containing protein [Tanacetum cinerariifolium]